jgi:hypothetical protein
MIPAEFQSFWRRLFEAQGEDLHEGDGSPEKLDSDVSALTGGVPEASEAVVNDRLRARFEKEGLHCEVEGSSSAVADFLKRVSGWETGQG